MYDRQIRESLFPFLYSFFSNGRPKLWTCSEWSLDFIPLLLRTATMKAQQHLLDCLRGFTLGELQVLCIETHHLMDSYVTDVQTLLVRVDMSCLLQVPKQLMDQSKLVAETGFTLWWSLEQLTRGWQYKGSLAGLWWKWSCWEYQHTFRLLIIYVITGLHRHRYPWAAFQCRIGMWRNAVFLPVPVAMSFSLSGHLEIINCLSDTFHLHCPLLVDPLHLECQKFRL